MEPYMNIGTINRTFDTEVAESFVKCMLSDISEHLGYFTKDELDRTVRYFDYKCPYTGQDIRQSFYHDDYVIDYLIPMDISSWGLHLYGNIIVTTREVLKRKRRNFFENFIYHCTEGTEEERIQRIEKIRNFQEPYLFHYRKIQKNEALKELCKSKYNSILEQLEKLESDYLSIIHR